MNIYMIGTTHRKEHARPVSRFWKKKDEYTIITENTKKLLDVLYYIISPFETKSKREREIQNYFGKTTEHTNIVYNLKQTNKKNCGCIYYIVMEFPPKTNFVIVLCCCCCCCIYYY
mmetsp:Transcript_9070/g.13217  ORF Transcript_9070/g.13217 Transcript_9070/m.13217 type:complete len:116 (-) Transcript_9070:188-535(-)